MITASFFDGGRAFEIKGHSGSAESGSDIIGAKADIKVKDGYMRFRLTQDNKEAERLIEGLDLHIRELSKQYPENVIRLKLKSK